MKYKLPTPQTPWGSALQICRYCGNYYDKSKEHICGGENSIPFKDAILPTYDDHTVSGMLDD